MTASPHLTPLYAFVHLPKTAGQSLRDHLNTIFDDPRAVAPVNEHADFQGPEIEALQARGAALRLVVGHRVTEETLAAFAPRPVRKVIVLRDPVLYMISYFNWDHREETIPPGHVRARFERWLKIHRNRQARWILRIHAGLDISTLNAMDDAALLAAASAQLDGFWCVGRVEDIPGSLAPLFEALGATRPFNGHLNKGGRDYPQPVRYNPRIAARIEEETRVDRQLYESYALGPSPAET